MIKVIGIASSLIAGGIVGYNHLKYIDAPEAPVIQNVETNISNPKVPVNKLDFTSEIMDKNLLYVTGFEDGDMQVSYVGSSFPEGHYREFGGQSRSMEESSDGKYSTKIEDTVANSNVDNGYDSQGNHLGYGILSDMKFKGRFHIPEDSNISLSMDVLNTKDDILIESLGIGGQIDHPTSWGDRIFLSDARVGDSTIKISGLTSYERDAVAKGCKYYIVTRDRTNEQLGNYYYTYIKSIDLDKNEATLNDPLGQEFSAGEEVLAHTHINPMQFYKYKVSPTTDWKTIQIPATINKNSGYSIESRGISFWVRTTTPGVSYLDNIRIGYANNINIQRDGQSIYSGYRASIEDKTAKDLDTPNKIESIQSNIILKGSNTNQIKVNITAPEDNGTEYTYTATASFDGKESRVSEPVKSVVKTGIDGYSYVIDTNPITEPGNTIDTRETSIIKDVANDDSTYYLHIKAIDKAGNVGETTHKKIELHETTSSLVEENGDIRLNWTFSDSDLSNYYFKVFRKENEGEFVEIVANTVDTNYLDINTSDKEKPSIPILRSTNYNKLENTFEFIFNDSIDDGTNYSYYVEAYLNDNSKVSTSNIVSANVSSGLNGYSYVINSNQSFTPDDTINNFLDNKISVPVSNSGNYIHIKAIDNQGNASEVLSIKAYDDVNPTLDLRLTDYRPNNTGLSIVVTGHDNTSVKSIRLPNGSIVEDRTVNFEVTKNGEYEFTVYDVAGNSFTKSINITNIDKTPPTIEFEELKEGDEYKIKVIAKDEGGGISHIILPNGDRINSDNHTITVEPNTLYEFKAYDLAGNFSVRSTQIGILEPGNATANLDVYIKSQNMLSLSLNNNSISFEDFNGTEDLAIDGALELSINSSLPYEINAYLEEEIQNTDKSEIMDKSILNLKESIDTDYKEFVDIKTKLNLVPHSDAGNDKLHSFDFKLNGGIAHKKDVYKATIKFEVKQK